VHTTSQPCDFTIPDSLVLFLVERLCQLSGPRKLFLIWISIWFDRKSPIYQNASAVRTKSGSAMVRGLGNASSVGAVGLVSSPRYPDSAPVQNPSSKVPPCRFEAMPAIAHLVPFGSLCLRPATTCDRALLSERRMFVRVIHGHGWRLELGRWPPMPSTRRCSHRCSKGHILVQVMKLGATPRLQLI
jgi:hypothetical protein